MQASFPQVVRPFVKFLQSVGSGRIKGLRIQDGLPVLDPPPTVVQEVRFGPGPDGRMPCGIPLDDIPYTVPMVQLLWCFRQIGAGTIDTLYVRHGLPLRMFSGHAVDTSEAWQLLQQAEGGSHAA